jgi:membrane protease YdiL (CAAX protease family)
MYIYIETLILYMVLFFSGATGAFVNEVQESFSTIAELKRLFLYSIPSLALIWYMLLRVKSLSHWDIKPGKKDLVCGLVTFLSLIIIGFVMAFVSSRIISITMQHEAIEQAAVHPPATALQWVVLVISCIVSAYVEESFFRFYILARRDELKLHASYALLLSVALFAICHIYEGPWGFLNSVLSGTLLCFMFLRYKAFHGITIAHGLYNVSVFVINSALIQN